MFPLPAVYFKLTGLRDSQAASGLCLLSCHRRGAILHMRHDIYIGWLALMLDCQALNLLSHRGIWNDFFMVCGFHSLSLYLFSPFVMFWTFADHSQHLYAEADPFLFLLTHGILLIYPGRQNPV